VRVTADDGTYGWGEGYGPARVVRAGVEALAPLVVGADALSSGVVWQEMHRRFLDYARRGVLVASISAVDVAMWDLKGKLLGAPVSALLGGAHSETCPVYATGMYFTEGEDLPRRLAREAAGYAERGFGAVKMKVGFSIEQDVANVRAVREGVGPDVGLMVDANHAYSRAEARRLAGRLEEFDVAWFEEPLSPDDYDGYAELRRATSIPVAAGECEHLCEGFRELLTRGCVGVAQPDICAAGGITEAVRIAALARAFGTPLTPHCWGAGIVFAAALHFVSTVHPVPGRMRQDLTPLEMDCTENPLRDELTVPRFKVEGGRVRVPEAPGLGVDVDGELLKSFSVVRL
jgi:D-galactarolactone cycloisomerase